MTTFDRAWRGARSDWRLHLLSVFSVAVSFICLSAALLVVVNVDRARQRWERAGHASVYLRASTKLERVREIERVLRSLPSVQGVKYVSSEEAGRDLLGAQQDAVLDRLPTDAFPASLELTLTEGVAEDRLQSVSARLAALPEVESVETYRGWTERLRGLLHGGVSAALLLAAVVLMAVVSVVATTVRLTLQRRRVEVEVLKLVGATDNYVRAPFVLEGALQGLIGSVLAVVVVGAVYAIVQNSMDGGLALLAGLSPTFLPWSAVLLLVLLGVALGAGASFVSLRRMVNV